MRLFARALVGAVTLAMVSAGAAHAAVGSPPVTGDDAVTMVAGGIAQPDVLANDSDPDGDKLAVCRVRSVPAALHAEIMGGQLTIFASVPGTYSFTYYACDYSYLTPATVTVTVKAPPQLFVKVVKGERPGTLRVVNNGKLGFAFYWGSYKSKNEDGHVHVSAHSSVRIRVRRVSLIWVAFNERKGAVKAGVIRGITLPKGTHALPPGAPPAGATPFRPRWGLSSR